MDIVKKQIEACITSEGPYFPPPEEIYQVQTDINVWPYNRVFRGRPESSEPIVWEREAGYQEILSQKSIDSIVGMSKSVPSSHCFQIPCSTTLPCKNAQRVYRKNGNYCVYTSP